MFVCQRCGLGWFQFDLACGECRWRRKVTIGAAIVGGVSLLALLGGLARMQQGGCARAPLWDKSLAAQQERVTLIARAEGIGAFKKVELNSKFPVVWVSGVFYGLPFPTKERFVGAVFRYCLSGLDDSGEVTLRDWLDGREVGSYDARNGLVMR